MAVVPAAWIPCNTFLSTNAVDTVGILQTFYYARWIGSIEHCHHRYSKPPTTPLKTARLALAPLGSSH